MRKLEKFLKESKILKSTKLTPTTFKITAKNGGISLEGTCSINMVEGSILSKNNKPLYTIKESGTETGVIRKLEEFSKYFEDATEFSQDDLDREDPEKELLLDDTSFDSEEYDFNSIPELIEVLKDVSEKTADLPELEDASPEVKATFDGVVSSLYATIDNLNALSEIMNIPMNESVAVPAKTDFIDLAVNNISQACINLRNSEEYKQLIGILENVKSELIISRD